MKKEKSIIKVILLAFIAFLFWGINSNVEASTSLTQSKTVDPGTVTVTASVTAGDWNLTLEGAGNSKSMPAPSGEGTQSSSVSITFNAIAGQSYTFTLKGDETAYQEGVINEATPVDKKTVITVNNPTPPANTDTSNNNGQQAGNQQGHDDSNTPAEDKPKPVEIIKQEVAKSSNCSLSSIKVKLGETEGIIGEFNRGTTDYTLTFPESVSLKDITTLRVYATSEDNTATKYASAVVGGKTTKDKTKFINWEDINIEEGENLIKILCVAENGTEKTYVIKFTKPTPVKESDLRLSELKVVQVNKDGTKSDLKLNEAFNKDNLVYTASVESAITQLLVTATPENANDISVEVKGADELKEGSNEILITLTSKKDESVKTTYKITVLKDAEVITTIGANTVDKNAAGNIKKNKGFDTIVTIFIVVVAILFAVLVTLIVIYKKKNKKRRYQDQEIRYDDVRDLVNKYAKEESEKNVLDDINEENDLDKYNDSEEDTSLFSRFRDEEDEKDEKEDTVIFKTEDEDSKEKDLGEEEDNKIEDDLVQENEQFKNEKIEDISADEEEKIDWDVISREDKKAEDFDDSSAWDEAEKQKSIQDWLNIGEISSDDDNTPTPPPTKGRKSGGKRFK